MCMYPLHKRRIGGTSILNTEQLVREALSEIQVPDYTSDGTKIIASTDYIRTVLGVDITIDEVKEKYEKIQQEDN